MSPRENKRKKSSEGILKVLNMLIYLIILFMKVMCVKYV